ncbi:hypothetical protein O0L34_g12791 [Tuta absoluta]|nr:hypothetical protein O0L34_g12791 [Tuta absoluta]
MYPEVCILILQYLSWSLLNYSAHVGLQGLLCYSPKVLWQRVENGLLSKLMSGMQGILCRKDVVEKRIDVIIWYIQRYRRQHKLYPLAYWFCEGLCLINLVLQMILMDRFLGGNFFSLSLNYLKISDVPDYKRTDPLIYVFPRVTKCDFYKVGYSGTITNVDYLCILPHNVINEKIYIFLLLWYVLMSAMFVCLMIYRIALILFPGIRPWLIVARTTRSVSYEDGAGVSSKLDLGDWWLFYMLAKNMDPLAFRDLLSEFMSREKKNTLLSG